MKNAYNGQHYVISAFCKNVGKSWRNFFQSLRSVAEERGKVNTTYSQKGVQYILHSKGHEALKHSYRISENLELLSQKSASLC